MICICHQEVSMKHAVCCLAVVCWRLFSCAVWVTLLLVSMSRSQLVVGGVSVPCLLATRCFHVAIVSTYAQGKAEHPSLLLGYALG